MISIVPRHGAPSLGRARCEAAPVGGGARAGLVGPGAFRGAVEAQSARFGGGIGLDAEHRRLGVVDADFERRGLSPAQHQRCGRDLEARFAWYVLRRGARGMSGHRDAQQLSALHGAPGAFGLGHDFFPLEQQFGVLEGLGVALRSPGQAHPAPVASGVRSRGVVAQARLEFFGHDPHVGALGLEVRAQDAQRAFGSLRARARPGSVRPGPVCRIGWARALR